ncbi:MAG: hypothetical protein MK135_16595 [Polyangiaceae bacterium]|nr:hypothetical protein [Polyangiaceae bacterium]
MERLILDERAGSPGVCPANARCYTWTPDQAAVHVADNALEQYFSRNSHLLEVASRPRIYVGISVNNVRAVWVVFEQQDDFEQFYLNSPLFFDSQSDYDPAGTLIREWLDCSRCQGHAVLSLRTGSVNFKWGGPPDLTPPK